MRGEYIAGGTSYRKLAEKYGVNKTAVARKAKAENWDSLRNETRDKTCTKCVQKTASAIAENATKGERAKALALDVIVSNLEHLKEMQGSRVTTKTTDKKGNPVTVDFSLNDMISALDKLTRNNTPTEESVSLKRAREILGGVKSAID